MLHLNDRLHTRCVRAGLVACILSLAAWSTSSSVAAQDATAGAGTTHPAEPAWKSSPFHGVIGGDGNVIPCRCLYRGMAYKLGEKVCMNTHLGTVLTECDLQQNNTSWVPTSEACTIS